MIIIPFLYFSTLALYVYKKHKTVSVAFLICVMFAASGFFSILIDIFHLRSDDTMNYIITPQASLIYCGFLTLCLSPFIIHPNHKIQICPVRNDAPLKTIAWISFLWLVVLFIVSWPYLIRNLTLSDVQEMRTSISHGDEQNYMLFLPTIVKVPLIYLNMVFSCSWILIFLAFYCLLIQKISKLYFWLFLLASLSAVLFGILAVDRAKTTYWIISFIVVYYFFKSHITVENGKMISQIMYFFMILAFLYLAYVTVGRFGERDYGSISGSQGGIISYLGQNYINFCFFFDNYTPPVIDLSLIFPFTYKFIFGQEIVNAATIQDFMTSKTGISTGVFYTFIGHIIVAAGVLISLLYCIFYSFISERLLRPFRFMTKVTLYRSFIYLALASVLFQGIWVYYYTSPTLTFSLFFFLFFFKNMESKKRRKVSCQF